MSDKQRGEDWSKVSGNKESTAAKDKGADPTLERQGQSGRSGQSVQGSRPGAAPGLGRPGKQGPIKPAEPTVSRPGGFGRTGRPTGADPTVTRPGRPGFGQAAGADPTVVRPAKSGAAGRPGTDPAVARPARPGQTGRPLPVVNRPHSPAGQSTSGPTGPKPSSAGKPAPRPASSAQEPPAVPSPAAAEKNEGANAPAEESAKGSGKKLFGRLAAGAASKLGGIAKGSEELRERLQSVTGNAEDLAETATEDADPKVTDVVASVAFAPKQTEPEKKPEPVKKAESSPKSASSADTAPQPQAATPTPQSAQLPPIKVTDAAGVSAAAGKAAVAAGAAAAAKPATAATASLTSAPPTSTPAAGAAATRTTGGTPAASSAAETKPETKPASGSASRPSGSSGSRRTRKARLRITRIDPWSVMKTSLMFAVAFGIMSWVATYVVWSILLASGLFDSINNVLNTALSNPDSTSSFRLQDIITTERVLGYTALFAVLNVVIITALSTLFSFLYNLAASVLGGLEVTLAED